MNAILADLVIANIAGGAVILAVMRGRGWVHRHMGAGAAYLMWLAVPAAMLATLIPARTVMVETASGGMAASVPDIAALLLAAVWAIGAMVMAARLWVRQRAFAQDAKLGLAGPAVVGVLDPYVVTPADFETRFSESERRLILAHEQVHLERHDTRINAAVAAARCAFWFNPLVHIGAERLRVDQEASCDEEVMDRRPKARRIYAETLLKTQLASRSLPVGCYWPEMDAHPLAARIEGLARKPVSMMRRAAAAGLMVMAAGGAGVAAWAAQPAREVVAPPARDVFVAFQPMKAEGWPPIAVRVFTVPGSHEDARPPDGS